MAIHCDENENAITYKYLTFHEMNKWKIFTNKISKHVQKTGGSCNW